MKPNTASGARASNESGDFKSILEEDGAPSPEELLAYHNGELSPEAEEKLQDRIVANEDAIALLVDMKRFPNVVPGPGAPQFSDDEVTASMQALQRRIERDEEKATVVPIRPWYASLTVAYGIAATFLIATLGLSLRLATGPQPTLDSGGIDMYVRDVQTRDDASPKIARSEQGWLSLPLNIPSRGLSHQNFQIEVHDPSNLIVYSASCKRGNSTVLFLRLPAGYLKIAGTYQIKLFGITNEKREFIGNFALPYTLE